jgi:indoleamine 2,3-dioxygenase
MGAALERMNRVLERMPEGCDPYIYYQRVRPYIHGWKDHPALPQGLLYESVDAFGGRPQQFRGETGAQSAIIPALDAVLGIDHEQDPLRHFLQEMRDYMPARHRAFVAAIERIGSVRCCVLDNHRRHPPLRTLYNRCIEQIHRFRATHLRRASDRSVTASGDTSWRSDAPFRRGYAISTS